MKSFLSIFFQKVCDVGRYGIPMNSFIYSYYALQHIAFDRQQPCQHKLCEDFEMGEINHKQNIYIDF